MKVASKRLKEAEAELNRDLRAYARPDRVISDIEASGASAHLREAEAWPRISVGDYSVRIIDRRIVGADWLRSPAPSPTQVPRISFSSVKGGVGRSTALSVVAAHLSRRGRRVLAVDFDLEAPGIGTMLLNEDQLPLYGSLDYLVENGLSGIDRNFMS